MPREDVVANQRERLFGAMVASVAERGYAATTVSDLVKISGVSSRTFYDLFADKQACFVAALEAMVQAAVVYSAQSVGEAHGEKEPAGVRLPDEPGEAANWDEQARRGFDAFAEMIAVQPAAARMALIEAHVAGPEALVPVEQAAAGFEWLTRQMLEQSPERAGMPPELVMAHIGAQQEIARTRLRRGTESELPEMTDELWELISAFRPPPEPLKLTGRTPKPQQESIDAHDHSERALRAFAIVAAERGYANTTIDEVLKRAQMSASTFYTHFSGKEDAMLAAIDTACAQAVAAILPVFSRQTQWPVAIRAAYGAMLNFLASRPALARFIAVEVYGAGDQAVERRNRGLQPLGSLIENNTGAWHQMPPIVYEAIAGSTFRLLYQTVKDSGPGALPALAPVCTYLTLFPFLGGEEACAAANGDGNSRPGAGGRWSAATDTGAIPFRVPIKRTVSRALLLLAERPATAGEIAAEVAEDVEVVRSYLNDLISVGAVEVADPADRKGSDATIYRASQRIHRLHMVSSQQASMMSAEERRQLTADVWLEIDADVELAVGSGSFDKRLDRCLARTPLHLDKKGWLELIDLHVETLHSGFEIQARSTKRMEESGEEAIEARSVQLAFEMPAHAGPGRTSSSSAD